MPPKAVKKPTFDYIKEAILALKERGGSSQVAIKTWIAKTYPSAKIAPHVLKQAFKSGVEKKLLTKVSMRARFGWVRWVGSGGVWGAARGGFGRGVKVAGGRRESTHTAAVSHTNTTHPHTFPPNHRSRLPTSSPRYVQGLACDTVWGCGGVSGTFGLQLDAPPVPH